MNFEFIRSNERTRYEWVLAQVERAWKTSSVTSIKEFRTSTARTVRQQVWSCTLLLRRFFPAENFEVGSMTAGWRQRQSCRVRERARKKYASVNVAGDSLVRAVWRSPELYAPFLRRRHRRRYGKIERKKAGERKEKKKGEGGLHWWRDVTIKRRARILLADQRRIRALARARRLGGNNEIR